MRFSIMQDNPTPLYRQIVDQVKAGILRGELRPGEALPSIRQLAEDLLASVITTKRAYADLEAEGLIVTRPGLGTFVAELGEEALRRLKQEIVLTHLRRGVEAAGALGLDAAELAAMFRWLLDDNLDGFRRP